MKTGASFSHCKNYRYKLWRIWDDEKPLIAFCMLNPSTADASSNDPTVERCQRRAEQMGYGGLIVINVFALRSTDPKNLYTHEDPIGPKNSQAISQVAKEVKTVVCGWGKHGSFLKRDRRTLLIIKSAGAQTMALKINKDGSPAHPLYIGYDVKPIPIDLLTR